MQVIDHQANWGDAHCDAPREYVCERPSDFNLFWDQIPLVPEQKDIVDYIFDTFFEKADCADEEEEEEDDEEPVEPTTEPPVEEDHKRIRQFILLLYRGRYIGFDSINLTGTPEGGFWQIS